MPGAASQGIDMANVLHFTSYNMHAVNTLMLLAEFGLNRLLVPPALLLAYALWATLYVFFQWAVYPITQARGRSRHARTRAHAAACLATRAQGATRATREGSGLGSRARPNAARGAGYGQATLHDSASRRGQCQPLRAACARRVRGAGRAPRTA